MVIEESILILSPIEEVWSLFTDLTCWSRWNTVMADVSSESSHLAEGNRFRYWIRPFVIPVFFESLIEEVIPYKKISWRGEKFGITAVHEYIFLETDQGVSLTSRERFSGGPFARAGMIFSRGRLKQMTLTLLKGLRDAAEKRKDDGRKDQARHKLLPPRRKSPL